jgi:putative NIF3 family GTP cyclohydrolase 1 type 2
MRIREIIDRIIAFHPPISRPDSVDVVKYGDPDKECTGLVITCFASADVIRKTAALGANFIIVHEPTFYSDRDETDWLKGNRIFQEKKRLLDETGVVIWRDHDHIHGGKPGKNRPYMDGIFYGIMQELGWEPYHVNYPNMPLIYRLPPRTVKELARELIDKLHLNGMRVIGEMDAKVSTVFICEHIFGNNRDYEIVAQADADNIDVLIPLEIVDWTLSEYVRDSIQLGRPRAILNMGHYNLEEIGMKYMTKWLPEEIGSDIPIHYVQSGDGFQYIAH